MDALISSLPSNTTDNAYRFYVYSTDENEGNVCTKSQVAAAKAKGWTPYYYDNEWKEYEGSDDETTGITLPEMEIGNAPVYNLSGQKVSTPQKGGIYVIGGKKVVVK